MEEKPVIREPLDEGLNRLRKGGVNTTPPVDVIVPPPPPPQQRK